MLVQVLLTYLPKQSPQSILQITNTFENTLTIAITNKGKNDKTNDTNDTTKGTNVLGLLLTRVLKLSALSIPPDYHLVIYLSRSRCKYKTRSRCKCKSKTRSR